MRAALAGAGRDDAATTLRRCDLLARAGLAEPAMALAAALERDPVGLLRALEDDGLGLSAPTAAALREMLLTALRAADARLAAAPDDVAALVRRAVVRRLRGDADALVLEDLARADRLAGDPGRADRLWVATGADPSSSNTQALAPHVRDFITPERDEFLRRFWLPERPLGPGGLAERVQAAMDAFQREPTLAGWVDAERWLDRWVEAEPAARRQRALVLTKVTQQVRALPHLWLRAQQDARAVVADHPEDAELALILGQLELASRDLDGAAVHLELAARRAPDQVRAVLAAFWKAVPREEIASRAPRACARLDALAARPSPGPPR